MTSSVEITFAGHTLILDGSGVLYWPQEKLLVASDLHFEKASFLAQHGSLIAPYDTLDTLERLNSLMSFYQPRELLLLGDSFHDRHAWARLDIHLKAKLDTLMRRVEQCRWIEGNHDISILGHALPSFESNHERFGIIFSHVYETSHLPNIIGHYHPKTSFSLNGQKIHGRCFVHSDSLLVMPAFGSFTGGLNIQDPAFKKLFQHQEKLQTFLAHKNKLYKLP